MPIRTGVTALFFCVLVSPTGAAAQPAPATPAPLAGVCSVRDHGATGARAQNATAPVQKAIDACHARGGGTVVVPPGEYTTGTIVLKDNVTLWLEAGAVFYLSQDKADFPSERALVFADGARNIAIRGRGRFDGQARYEWGPPEEQDTEILEEERLAREAGVDMRRWLRRGLQAMTFVFKRCQDVLVEDVTLVGSTLWNVRLWGCDGVVFRGVTIESDLERAANSDGIDIDGSRNVRISDCRIETADDAIVLKTGKWRWDGQGESHPDRERGGDELRAVDLFHRLHDRHRDLRGRPPRRLQRLGRPPLEQGLRHQRPGRGDGRGRAGRQRDHGPRPPPLELVGQRRALLPRAQEEDPRVAPGRGSQRRGPGRRGARPGDRADPRARPRDRSRTSRSPASSSS